MFKFAKASKTDVAVENEPLPQAIMSPDMQPDAKADNGPRIDETKFTRVVQDLNGLGLEIADIAGEVELINAETHRLLQFLFATGSVRQ